MGEKGTRDEEEKEEEEREAANRRNNGEVGVKMTRSDKRTPRHQSGGSGGG